jgi:hypothetical protein
MSLISEPNFEVCVPSLDWIADIFVVKYLQAEYSEYRLRLAKIDHMSTRNYALVRLSNTWIG